MEVAVVAQSLPTVVTMAAFSLVLVPTLTAKLTSKLRVVLLREIETWGVQQVINIQCTISRLKSENILGGAIVAFLDTLSLIAHLSVSDEFYMTFLPALFWAGNAKLGRQACLLFATCLYFGNAIKDTIQLPRPCHLTKQVQIASGFGMQGNRSEPHGADGAEYTMGSSSEYGFPSTHMLNTTATCFLMGSTLLKHFSMAKGLMALWMGFVGFDRLYSGVHTLPDVIAGLFLGACLFHSYNMTVASVDNFLFTELFHPVLAIAILACFVLALIRAYPVPRRPTPSRDYALSFLGTYLGVASGIRLNSSLGMVVGECGLKNLIPRIAIGLPLMIVTKEIVKIVLRRLTSNADLIRVLSYAFVALTVLSFIPLVFP